VRFALVKEARGGYVGVATIGYCAPSLCPQRLGAGGSDFAAVLQPPSALGRQLPIGRGVIKFEFLGAQHVAPSSIGALVEEGIRATL
jgi:hypothetical protein